MVFVCSFSHNEHAKSSKYSVYLQNLVNGYVFKGKPMIIQFGRNPTAGKTM